MYCVKYVQKLLNDEGIDIDQKKQKVIFEKFTIGIGCGFGFGVGLSIAKSIILQ